MKANAIDTLFARFNAAPTDRGYVALVGQIVNATVVSASKQRNIEGAKAAIRQGNIAERWKERRVKIRQKDRDVR